MIAAMPDSITREELMREVADRLDADPGLVARRVAAAGRGGTRPRAAPEPTPAEARRRRAGRAAPRALNARERRELGLLAMCMHAAGRGPRVPRAGSPTSTSRARRRRARGPGSATTSRIRWRGLSRDDEELFAYVTDVKLRAEREPASAEAMELSFLELERAQSTTRSPPPRRTAATPRSSSSAAAPSSPSGSRAPQS